MKLFPKTIMTVSALVLVLSGFLLLAPGVSASSIQEGVNAAHASGMPTDLFGIGGTISSITNILLFIAGTLSVIMIIIGGLRYVLSGGNSATVTAAKNTIMYAIVGLIVAFLAFAAVNFILGALVPGSNAGWTNV